MCEPGYDSQRLCAARERLLRRLFTRQEEERERIAHELHEGMLQHLAALALALDCLSSELAAAKSSTRERLTCVRTMALSLIQDLRRLATELRPSLLDHLGLAPAVRSYAEGHLSKNGVQIHFDASDMEQRPSRLLETSLYRMAQEAIDNIATHAEARTVGITLKCDERLLTLVVEDDGKGFATAEVLTDPHAGRGLGILSMQERIASVGGSCFVGSVPGEGTQVRAKVPLDNESKAP